MFVDWLDMTRSVVAADRSATSKFATLIHFFVLQAGDVHGFEMKMLQNDWSYFTGVFDFVSKAFDEIVALWIVLIEQGIEEGTIRPDVDPIILISIMRSITADVPRWYQSSGPYSLKEIADAVTAFLLSGLIN